VSETTSARSVASGGMWSLGAGVITLLASLVATPFVLRGLGDEAYGVYSIIQVVVGYFAMVDFGMGDASTRFSGDAYARNDRAGEAATVWTALAVQLLPSLAAIAVVTFGAHWLAADVLRLPATVHDAAVAAFPIAGLALIARNVATVFNSPQSVRLRYRNLALINVISGLTQIVLVPVVVHRGGDLVDCIIVVAATNGLSLVLHATYAMRLLPELRRPRVDLARARTLARYGGWMVGTTLIITIVMQSEKVLITRFSSPTALAYYAVAYSLAGVLTMLPRAIKGVLFPVFSRLQAGESTAPMAALYGKLVRSALIVMAPAAVVMCVLAAPFFRVWAGPAYGEHSPLPFYVLAIGFLASGLASLPVVLLKGIARVDLLARFNLIQVLPFLGLAALLTWYHGAVGGAVAFSLRALADAAMHFVAVRRLVDARVWTRPRQLAAFLGTSLLLAPPLVLLAFPSVSLPWRLAVTAAALAAHAGATWRLVFGDDERRALRSLVTRG
jgi:O-antigen/teichoic acid export membrane protein